jgi:hypothetical protein
LAEIHIIRLGILGFRIWRFFFSYFQKLLSAWRKTANLGISN